MFIIMVRWFIPCLCNNAMFYIRRLHYKSGMCFTKWIFTSGAFKFVLLHFTLWWVPFFVFFAPVHEHRVNLNLDRFRWRLDGYKRVKGTVSPQTTGSIYLYLTNKLIFRQPESKAASNWRIERVISSTWIYLYNLFLFSKYTENTAIENLATFFHIYCSVPP